MTSGSLIEVTKATPSSIYTVLNVMRKKGLIHTVEDPETAEKVNAIK